MEVLQQTPGQGLGVQTLPAPLKVVPPGQPAVGTGVQAQVVLSQHTPVQGTTEQVLMALKVVPAGHGGATWVHWPVVVLQQAMSTGQQVVQLQDLVKPVQLASVVFVHRPVRTSQHLPRQGLGVHEPPQMKVFGEAQLAGVAPVVQAQVVALQQTPRHGEGVHVPLQ